MADELIPFDAAAAAGSRLPAAVRTEIGQVPAVVSKYTYPVGGIGMGDLAAATQQAIASAAQGKPAPGSTVVLEDGSAVRWDGTRPIYPINDIALWGHSLAASGGGIVEAKINALTGANVSNQGIGGQTSTDIAIRKGAIVPLLTLTGGQIPADTTPVTVSAIIPGTNAYRLGGGGTFTYTGTLAGIPGTLTETVASGSTGGCTFTFARTTAGSATAVPAGTPFLVTSPTLPTNVSIFGMSARNDFYSVGGFNQAQLTRNLTAMVGTLTPLNLRFLMLAELNAVDERNGATESWLIARRAAILADNAERASLWPNNYYDLRRDFIDFGLAIANLTPTSTDAADVLADAPPTQLMGAGDVIHPSNAAGYPVMGILITKWLVKKGWYTYAGNTYPGAPTGLSLTATAGGFNATWTAPASNGGSAITGYVIQYRVGTAQFLSRIQTSAWSTSLSASVAGLPAQAHDVRVVAVNAQGPSDPSPVATITPSVGSDTTAPTAPTTVYAIPGDGVVTLTAVGATDAGGVTQVRAYSDADGYASVIATGSGLSVTVPSQTNGTPRTYKLAAGDAAGNWSGQSPVSNTVVPAPTTVLTSDSFNRADGALGTTDAALGGTAQAWSAAAPITVISNKMGKVAASGFNGTYLAGAVDAKLTSKVILGTGNLSFFLRRTDGSNYYQLIIAPDGVCTIRKNVAGTATSIGFAAAGTVPAGGAESTVSFRVVGSSIMLIVNGVPKDTRTDTALTAGTGAGYEIAADNTVRIEDMVLAAG